MYNKHSGAMMKNYYLPCRETLKYNCIMPNDQLLSYINQARKLGKTDDQVRQELLDAGWQSNDIEEVLKVNIPTQKSFKLPILILAVLVVAGYFVGAKFGLFNKFSKFSNNSTVSSPIPTVSNPDSNSASYVMDLYTKSTSPRMIDSVFTSSRVLTVNTPVLITVIADVGDGDMGNGPTIIKESVSLFRYSDSGKQIMDYGKMYDDGTHGDLKPNDGKYTSQISITDTTPKESFFAVSAQYTGFETQVFSIPVYITTFAVSAGPEQILQTIAIALEANDMNTVRQHVYPSKRNVISLQELDASEEFRLGLAKILRNAQPSRNDGGIAIFLSDADPIRLARDKDGSWKLVDW